MKYNKSRTYLLPMLASRVDLNFNKIRNTYLHTTNDFEHFRLHIEHVFDNFEDKLEYDKIIKKSSNFINEVKNDFEDSYIYSFALDNDFKAAYRNFVLGKYSKLSNIDKNLILSYWNSVYNTKSNFQFKTNLKDILNQSPILKKQLEEKLAVSLPDDAELSSIINIEDEIYYDGN